LLKKIGEEHVQYDFMKSLATKCGYFFFSKEHVNAITKQVLVYKDSEENRHLVVSSLSLLLVSGVFLMLSCWMIVIRKFGRELTFLGFYIVQKSSLLNIWSCC